jgi:hypothetical protein
MDSAASARSGGGWRAWDQRLWRADVAGEHGVASASERAGRAWRLRQADADNQRGAEEPRLASTLPWRAACSRAFIVEPGSAREERRAWQRQTASGLGGDGSDLRRPRPAWTYGDLGERPAADGERGHLHGSGLRNGCGGGDGNW